MSTIIDKLKDKFGNFVLPVTNTKAVYDDDGNRLDNLISGLNVEIITNTSMSLGDNIVNYAKNNLDGNIKNVCIGSFDGWYYLCFIKTQSSVYYAGIAYNLVTNYNIAFQGNLFESTCAMNPIAYKTELSAISNQISDAYNPLKTYAQRELCIYSNILWKSKVANNLGNTPAEGTYWTATSVGNEITQYTRVVDELNANLGNKLDKTDTYIKTLFEKDYTLETPSTWTNIGTVTFDKKGTYILTFRHAPRSNMGGFFFEITGLAAHTSYWKTDNHSPFVTNSVLVSVVQEGTYNVKAFHSSSDGIINPAILTILASWLGN